MSAPENITSPKPSLIRDPWLWVLMLTALVLHALVVWLGKTPEMIWDEDRYLTSARDLLNGFFTRPEWPEIIHGPGYPLFLSPLVALGLELQGLRFANAVLMALATALAYAMGRQRCGWVWGLVLASGMMLHPSFLRVSPYLMTEPLTLVCLTLFAWKLKDWLEAGSKAAFLWCAFGLAGAMLTRVIFGQVVEVVLIMLVVLWPFWKSRRDQIQRSAVVMLAALLLCVPYLIHTARMTGKLHCWSTYGNELLYWSTSAPNGDWFTVGEAIENPLLAPDHGSFLKSLERLNPQERDRAYAAKVKENLQTHPKRYLVNCLHNISRLAFGYPRSLREQELSAGLLFVVNVPLLILLAAANVLALWCWRALPFDLFVFWVFCGVYLSASILLPALARYGMITWPLLGLFTAHHLGRHLKLHLIKP